MLSENKQFCGGGALACTLAGFQLKTQSTSGVFLGKYPCLSLNVVIKALTGDMGCMSLSADEMREEMSSVPESILAALLLRKLASVTATVYAVSRAVRRQQRLWGSSRATSWGR